MSHFYGTLKGSRGQATRCGTKSSGMTTVAASWAGAIKTTLYVDAQGRDCFRVEQITWHGAGIRQVIAEGIIGTISAEKLCAMSYRRPRPRTFFDK